MKYFSIEDSKTTPFHSAGNGKCESQNRRINGAMRAALDSKQFKNWDLWLPYVVFGLNSLKSSRTQFSANFLVFGRNLKAPIDLYLESAKPITYEKFPGEKDNIVRRAAYDLYRQIRSIILKVQKSFDSHVQYMSKEYNKRATKFFFNENDWCYVKINVPETKFGPRWKGPYKIVKKTIRYTVFSPN